MQPQHFLSMRAHRAGWTIGLVGLLHVALIVIALVAKSSPSQVALEPAISVSIIMDSQQTAAKPIPLSKAVAQPVAIKPTAQVLTSAAPAPTAAATPVKQQPKQVAAPQTPKLAEPTLSEATPAQPASQSSVAATTAVPTSEPVKPVVSNQPVQINISAIRYAKAPKPKYPDVSQALGEKGLVLITLVIDTSGKVSEASIKKSSGFARLDQAALSAVKRATFVPYQENGTPRIATTVAPIEFN